MKLSLVLATLALTLAPALGAAQGCHDERAASSSCAQGHVWDPVKGQCVLSPSS